MPSTRKLIFFVLATLLLFLNTYQTAPVHYLIPDALQQHPSASSTLLQLWLERLQQQMEETEGVQPINDDDDAEHLWKRFAEFLPPNRERRRFGNTRYGRSVSTD